MRGLCLFGVGQGTAPYSSPFGSGGSSGGGDGRFHFRGEYPSDLGRNRPPFCRDCGWLPLLSAFLALFGPRPALRRAWGGLRGLTGLHATHDSLPLADLRITCSTPGAAEKEGREGRSRLRTFLGRGQAHWLKKRVWNGTRAGGKAMAALSGCVLPLRGVLWDLGHGKRPCSPQATSRPKSSSAICPSSSSRRASSSAPAPLHSRFVNDPYCNQTCLRPASSRAARSFGGYPTSTVLHTHTVLRYGQVVEDLRNHHHLRHLGGRRFDVVHQV
jgi:hypothetical protein